MAPDPSDPFVFASIHLLLHKQQKQRVGRPSRSRPSSHSKLLPSTSSGASSRRHHKRKSRSRISSKMPLHYLKPGALAQLRDAQRSARVSSSLVCATKKKRIASSINEAIDEEVDAGTVQLGVNPEVQGRDGTLESRNTQISAVSSMTPGPPVRLFGPLCPQRKKLLAPKTPLPPTVPSVAAISAPITPVNSSPPLNSDPEGESLLESLPLELLVRIVCNLHHDQLKPTFHVSRRLRQAVVVARQCHFDFTTPDRERQDALQLTTPRGDLSWPFIRANAGGSGPSRPPTPKAPRPAPKPLQARISLAEMQQLAGPLFPGSASRLRRVKPPSIPRPTFRAVASHRVLFYEEELCQAVAQNSL
ncbi:hypothetical protein GOP47_0011479 [Adiantum capillus-veneris]|uniref:F-box domain-containing protein n=1 Tax=Adiantum capillus-veneris TaxID=13818 RepID=A0A9D4ZHX0_ADICA|nr:hypothetical protein GOP47_0011479 [Adiantum capillus-veneris]